MQMLKIIAVTVVDMVYIYRLKVFDKLSPGDGEHSIISYTLFRQNFLLLFLWNLVPELFVRFTGEPIILCLTPRIA